MREADILVHIADISHPEFEEHIEVVRQTLSQINAEEKPTILLFNKIDAYTYIEKEEDDLSPASRENLSLEDLKQSWMASKVSPTLFISARKKLNISEFKKVLYDAVKEIHMKRYPYNNYLFDYEE